MLWTAIESSVRKKEGAIATFNIYSVYNLLQTSHAMPSSCFAYFEISPSNWFCSLRCVERYSVDRLEAAAVQPMGRPGL